MAGGSNSVNRMSPRQRMINLMYIVLTAMLALNVSSDVLNGFALVQESLNITNRNISERNKRQFLYLESVHKDFPKETDEAYRKGKAIHEHADSLYRMMDALKLEIAQAADGPDANLANIENREDLEAASSVMLDPLTEKGKKLRVAIDNYRAHVLKQIPDSARRKNFEAMLSTNVKNVPGVAMQPTWEEQMFDNMPVVATLTMLTKIQGDIRLAESEAMTSIISTIASIPGIPLPTDVPIESPTIIEVKEMEAFVCANSNIIMRGGKYSANIVPAAIDTESDAAIFVGGRRLSGNLYEFTPTSTGKFDYSGYIQVMKSDGTVEKLPFQASYTVIEPMATISPTMMNVIYAGIDNPISISVPGIPMSSISASMTNGTLTRNGDSWVARSSQIGAQAVISVTAEVDGRQQQVGSMTFRVRKLPDPTAYMPIGDNQYKGTPRRISKGALMGCPGINAALDDGVLDIRFTVVSFTTVFFDQMGNAMPEISAGASFSERQKEKFRQLKPGKSFFITNIKAKGPDGVVRDISPMEVGLN